MLDIDVACLYCWGLVRYNIFSQLLNVIKCCGVIHMSCFTMVHLTEYRVYWQSRGMGASITGGLLGQMTVPTFAIFNLSFTICVFR